DPWAFAAFGSVMLGHFHRSRYEEAAAAAYKAVQANPAHSINYVLLTAALAKVGRLEEASTAAARVMELHPEFRYGRQFSGARRRLQLPSARRFALRACLNSLSGRLPGCDHIVRRYRPPDPLQLELTDWLDLHGVLDFCQHPRADENLARFCLIA